MLAGAIGFISSRFTSSPGPKGAEDIVRLCCPSSSSSLILDEAMRQIAISMKSDVVVIDANDLADGDSGILGPG